MIEPLQIFSDPQEVEEHYRNRQVEVQVKPAKKGDFLYQKRTAGTNGMFMRSSIMHTPWAMENRNDSDVFFVSLPATGNVSWKVEGRWETPRSVFIVDNRLISEAKYSEGTMLDTVVIPAQTLHTDLAALTGSPCHKRIKFGCETTLSASDIQVLSYIAKAMKTEFDNSSVVKGDSIAISYLRQAMTTIVLQRARHNYTAVLNSIPSDVTSGKIKRAIDFIFANAHRPLRLDQIAGAAALSVRGLQTGFMRHHSVTPMRFLQNVRLEYVRADLRNPDIQGSWQEIAMHWGFTNCYRFAQAYFTAFGESPLQTYRKVRF